MYLIQINNLIYSQIFEIHIVDMTSQLAQFQSKLELPTFIPTLPHFFAPFLSPPFLPLSPRSDPNDEVSRVAVLQWISLSDFYIWPHISQFNSWEELFTLLVRTYVRENVHISIFFGSFIN